MRKALCVLHTSRGDNGSYTVVEAAWQGTPSLSNRYPAMEDVGAYFGLPLEFFDYYRPGSLADSLRRVLAERSSLCARLPSRSQLVAFSFENLAMRYWQLFSAQMRKALGAVR
jgi:glycosyltransferase involved in cell wall biosynthesis